MDILLDAFIVTGLASLALLWIACAAGALHALWETFGEYIQQLLKRMKG